MLIYIIYALLSWNAIYVRVFVAEDKRQAIWFSILPGSLLTFPWLRWSWVYVCLYINKIRVYSGWGDNWKCLTTFDAWNTEFPKAYSQDAECHKLSRNPWIAVSSSQPVLVADFFLQNLEADHPQWCRNLETEARVGGKGMLLTVYNRQHFDLNYPKLQISDIQFVCRLFLLLTQQRE